MEKYHLSSTNETKDERLKIAIVGAGLVNWISIGSNWNFSLFPIPFLDCFFIHTIQIKLSGETDQTYWGLWSKFVSDKKRKQDKIKIGKLSLKPIIYGWGRLVNLRILFNECVFFLLEGWITGCFTFGKAWTPSWFVWISRGWVFMVSLK